MIAGSEMRLVPMCVNSSYKVIIRNCLVVPTSHEVHTSHNQSNNNNHIIEGKHKSENCVKCDKNKIRSSLNDVGQLHHHGNHNEEKLKNHAGNLTAMSISIQNQTRRLRNSLFNMHQITKDNHGYLQILTNMQIRPYCSRCTFEMGKLPVGFRTSPPWRVLFFGTDEFSISSLHALNASRLSSNDRIIESLEVVNATASQNKHKTPVLKYANQAGIKVHNWPVKVDDGKYDVGVLSSFGHMIPERIIHKFPYGIINIHPSLLPRWRGASPITHTILNGDSVTGVSIMEIRPKHFDIGPLLMQNEICVPDRCTTQQLQDILAPIGTNMLMTVLRNLPVLERCEVEQTPYGVTYAHKINPHMFYVDWKTQTMEDIDRQYRALHEMGPLISVFMNNKIKLLDLCLVQDLDLSEAYLQRIVKRDYKVSQESLVLPGSALYVKNQKTLIVKCKDGWVGFKRIIGKNPMTPGNFHSIYLRHPDVANRKFVSIENDLNKDCDKERVAA